MNTLTSYTRQLAKVCVVAVLLSSGTAAVVAQDAPANPANNGVVVTMNTKSYVKEAIIFAILGGAAIFAVCRSSPRGL